MCINFKLKVQFIFLLTTLFKELVLTAQDAKYFLKIYMNKCDAFGSLRTIKNDPDVVEAQQFFGRVGRLLRNSAVKRVVEKATHLIYRQKDVSQQSYSNLNFISTVESLGSPAINLIISHDAKLHKFKYLSSAMPDFAHWDFEHHEYVMELGNVPSGNVWNIRETYRDHHGKNISVHIDEKTKRFVRLHREIPQFAEYTLTHKKHVMLLDDEQLRIFLRLCKENEQFSKIDFDKQLRDIVEFQIEDVLEKERDNMRLFLLMSQKFPEMKQYDSDHKMKIIRWFNDDAYLDAFYDLCQNEHGFVRRNSDDQQFDIRHMIREKKNRKKADKEDREFKRIFSSFFERIPALKQYEFSHKQKIMSLPSALFVVFYQLCTEHPWFASESWDFQKDFIHEVARGNLFHDAEDPRDHTIPINEERSWPMEPRTNSVVYKMFASSGDRVPDSALGDPHVVRGGKYWQVDERGRKDFVALAKKPFPYFGFQKTIFANGQVLDKVTNFWSKLFMQKLNHGNMPHSRFFFPHSNGDVDSATVTKRLLENVLFSSEDRHDTMNLEVVFGDDYRSLSQRYGSEVCFFCRDEMNDGCRGEWRHENDNLSYIKCDRNTLENCEYVRNKL